MYSTNNEGKSVVTKSFIKSLKSKIYKKLTTNDSKSYLGYLNKLVDNKIMFIITLSIKKTY